MTATPPNPASRFSLPAPPGIAIRQARLDHDGIVLFDALSLEIDAGRWTCLLGPSGVGKTTLLRLIAGLERRAQGEIACDDGLPVAGRIAYMAQQDLLLPWLTVTENVLLGARLRYEPASDLQDRARSLLDQVGLGGKGDLRPDACSGGMRQRVALARTLIEDRPIVLMDEPFSALDAITRLQLQELAARMLAKRTVLLVTHDPLEALRLGHKIHVMTGRPALVGPPITPSGEVPRPPDDEALLAQQAELLARLSAAAAETAA